MEALKFNGKGAEYFKIWIVNILLTIVTVTLYYPWAKVRNRRYFYANTTLDDRNFEYHATGKQMFVGYLIGMGLLIVYLILQQLSPTIASALFLLLAVGFPWIIWRSLMFNMRVTSFSNVRFSFDGSLGGAYFNYLLLPFLLLVSVYLAPIGIAVFVLMQGGDAAPPSFGFLVAVLFLLGTLLTLFVFAKMQKLNTSYYLNSLHYGQGDFKTELDASVFFKILLKAIGLLILISIVYMIFVSVLALAFGLGAELTGAFANLEDPEALAELFGNGLVVLLVALVYIGFITIGMAFFAFFASRQREYILANTTLDGKIRMASTLRARSLFWLSFTNLLLVIVTLGLGTPWAKVRVARLIVENTEVDTSFGFDEFVTQQQTHQSALADQIGDAFDVDIGIGI